MKISIWGYWTESPVSNGETLALFAKKKKGRWMASGKNLLLRRNEERRWHLVFFYKNGPTRPLFRLFLVFLKQTIQFLQQINVQKCPSSIQRRYLNPRPLEHESSPITTRPGLHPSFHYVKLAKVAAKSFMTLVPRECFWIRLARDKQSWQNRVTVWSNKSAEALSVTRLNCFLKLLAKKFLQRADTVVQLVELSLPTPEIHGSNSAIGNFIYFQLYENCIERIFLTIVVQIFGNVLGYFKM